jgi:hypothetical protein
MKRMTDEELLTKVIKAIIVVDTLPIEDFDTKTKVRELYAELHDIRRALAARTDP